ncbi:Hint domain-containing protein [Paracoccus sp. IB05]|uniref:Hint domain-containing protein n=1 Tax=Paracoccus sp. IB05 TaxID=2779367 RepID=UPI0018E7E103|nr:Hint domain-containing protein [Paracoccus sp. IB05]MBJ2150212.1 Hint domain-containing protein [Paracoccus sp. IB05]
MTIIARYDFNETGGPYIQDSAPDNGNQLGWFMGSSYSENGRLILDGKSGFGKIYTDESFQLGRGTLEFQFSSASQNGIQTLVSRDSIDNTAGSFRTELMPDGTIRTTHRNETDTFVLESPAGFVGVGDEIRVTYSWDQGGAGGQANFVNLTTGATFSAPVPGGLGLDMGSVNQQWFFGAGQQHVSPGGLQNIDQYFHGTFSYVQVSDTVDNCPVVPCFTAGTLISTPNGRIPVELLKAGDRIITRDHGVQSLIWVGHRHLDAIDLSANPSLQPVMIRNGALGHGLPDRDLLVSPNHQMLIYQPRNQLHFSQTEVLVAAKFLVNGETILATPQSDVTYVHILFGQHELVLANGSWSESFCPGAYILAHIGKAQRDEIVSLFPELAQGAPDPGLQPARLSLTRYEAGLIAPGPGATRSHNIFPIAAKLREQSPLRPSE